MQVAVAGLGSIGMGAALNLARKGHVVTGVELREAAWPELEAEGGRCTKDAASIPEGTEALVLLVVNAAQADSVLHAALDRLAPDAVVINCVTVPPGSVPALSERVEATGRHYLDAPVSGGAAASRAGATTVMGSGSPGAFDRAQPVLDAIAGRVWRLGDRPGAGSTVKMVNQLLAGVHIAVAAEAMALGIRAGADPQTLFDVITTSAGNSWMFQNRVPHILDGDDSPRSAVAIFVKDLGIVLDQARSMPFPLPLASAAHQLFLAAAAGGDAAKDDAFVIRVWERLAGIALPAGPEPEGG